MDDEINYDYDDYEYYSQTPKTDNKDLNVSSSDIYYDTNDKIEFSLNNFNIVYLDQLMTVRNKLISEFIEQTFLDRDDAINALINYKWNLDKINDDWYNDVDGKRKNFGIDEDDNSIKLLAKNNIQKNSKYCLICYSEIDYIKKTDCDSLKCFHNFCKDCWKVFIISKLDDYFCCLYSTCPQKDCNLKIPESFFLKYLKEDNDNMERYEKIVLKNFTENNKNIKWCPRDCGRCSRTDIHSNIEVVCDCKYVYCFNCMREGHSKK